MKMADITSRTCSKMAEIPMKDFSINGIRRAINEKFGEPFFEDILSAIFAGYIQVCEDGIIVWCSGKGVNEND